MYDKNALLFHLPSMQITESSRSALAAVVAASMRKLSIPAICVAVRRNWK